MEPYELSLRQVNLEEKDIRDTDTLDSFGNLVCYDSDFKEDSKGLPVFAKKILGFGKSKPKRNSGENSQSFLIEQIHESKRQYYTQGQGRPDVYNSQDNTDDDSKAHYSSGSSPRQPGSSPREPVQRKSPVNDTFRSFTQTVDALALQSSVIGSSSVSPASPEEVAKVIAETQKRLQNIASDTPSTKMAPPRPTQERPPPRPNFMMEEPDDSLLISMTQEGDYDVSMTNSHHQQVTKVTTTTMEITKEVTNEDGQVSEDVTVDQRENVSVTYRSDIDNKLGPVGGMTVPEGTLTRGDTSLPEGTSADVDSQSVSSNTSFDKTLQSESEMSDSSVTKKSNKGKKTSASPYGENHGKSLIQIPKENITVEKSSSWFYNRGKACAHPNVARLSPEKAPMLANDFEDEDEEDGGHVVMETTAEVHAEDCIDSPQKKTRTPKKDLDIQESSQINTQSIDTHTHDNQSGDENGDTDPIHNPNNIPEITAFNEFCKPDLSSSPTAVKHSDSPDNNTSPTAVKHSKSDTSPTAIQHTNSDSISPNNDHRNSPTSVASGNNKHNNLKSNEDKQTPAEIHSSVIGSVHSHVPSNVDKRPNTKPVEEGHSQPTSDQRPNTKPVEEGHSQRTNDQRPNTKPVEGGHSQATSDQRPNTKPLEEGHSQRTNDQRSNTKPVEGGHSQRTSDQRSNTKPVEGGHSHTIDQELHTKPFVEVDITESPKNYEKKVKEMELENSDDQSDIGVAVSRFKDFRKIKKELERLMKAKAKLEGQLEVMEMEAKYSLKQRAELQSNLAALKEQLKSQETTVRAAIGERDAVSYDMLTLKQNKTRLEQVILDAHKLMADKDDDLKTLNDDLQLAQQTNESLQEKIKDVKREMQSKDTTIGDLKNKITELYVQFETTNQTKILLENEIRSLKSEIKTLATAKEWYQQQLQQTQESKTGLQREITNIKGEVITKTTMIERLKAENVRIKQHITDTQQRVIQEKQLLAQHLEAIEADMLEREEAFTQISRERDALQEVLKSRGESPEAALRDVVTSGDGKSGDNLTNDLDMRRLGNDIRRKEAHISVLEHEQAELMKRLALSQESIIERDKSIESLEKKYVDVEITLKKLQQDVVMKEEDLNKTRQEKGLIEGELSSVKAEKKAFDNVIQNLKDDMTKVERSFKHIKLELAQKREELHQIKLDKDKTNVELTQVYKDLSTGSHTTPQVQQEVLQQQAINEDLQNMKSQKSQLEQDLKLVKSESSSQIQQLISDKVLLENKLAMIEAKDRNSPERTIEMRNMVQQTIKEVEKTKETLVEKFSSKYVEVNKETLVREYVKVGDKDADHVIEENNRLKMVIIQMMDSMKGVIDDKIQGIKSELDDEKKDKHQLTLRLQEKSSKEHEHLTVRVKELERELHILRDNEARSDHEVAMALTLELEKEKGKLAAVLQTCDQLKAHTAQLEAHMAQQESSTVALSSQAQQQMRGRDKDIIDLEEKIRSMDALTQKDKHVIKEVKKQLISEKGSNVKTRRKFEALWVDHDQMRVDYENKIKETENLITNLDKTKDSEQKFRETCEKLNAELQKLKVEMEEMKMKVGEREAKDPVVGEHIKSLEWQIQQKEQELYAGRQQLQLVEDRQTIEVENMRKTIQGNTSELSKLREELSITKREKTSLQSRNTQLKNALKSTVQANKHGKKGVVDMATIEKLLQDTAEVTSQSKPLSFLQATLHDLRGEISTLQTQMDHHATAVQTSSQAWRELEQQVADLREVCKSTAADREASKGLLSGSVIAAAKSPVAMATQAVARSTTMQSNTTFIPPIPVKLPDNMDFSLPPIDGHILNGAHNVAIDTVTQRSMREDRRSQESTSSNEERRINTKGLIPNSVYSPPTPSK